MAMITTMIMLMVVAMVTILMMIMTQLHLKCIVMRTQKQTSVEFTRTDGRIIII